MIQNEDSLFAASLDRCQAAGNFMDRFYRAFMGANPEVKALFERVNMTRQAEMLAAALAVFGQAGKTPGADRSYVDELGQFHARLGVPEWMYDLWLDSLVQTVQICDPEYSPEVGEAWRAILGTGIAQMKGIPVPVPHPTARSHTGDEQTVTGPSA